MPSASTRWSYGELGARAVEVAARDDAARVEVDRLDLGDVHRRRREDPPRRAEHVAGADAPGDHLADEAVEGVEVLAADDRRRRSSPRRIAVAQRRG